MDLLSSIFSFDQISELLECSPDPFQQHMISENNNNIKPPAEPSQKRNFSTAFDDIDDNARNNKKKLVHRDVERQRRKEMANLQRSLRSLLPIECLKGKRSIADHLHETVGYIKQLQKRIEKLTEKRDKLKQLMNPSSDLSSGGAECLPSCAKTNVTVKTSRAGIEAVVSSAFIEGLKLSKVLNVLTEGGLSITSCTSTKVDGRLLHTIESEINEGRSTDSAELQQKLKEYCIQNLPTGKKDP